MVKGKVVLMITFLTKKAAKQTDDDGRKENEAKAQRVHMQRRIRGFRRRFSSAERSVEVKCGEELFFFHIFRGGFDGGFSVQHFIDLITKVALLCSVFAFCIHEIKKNFFRFYFQT